MRKDAILGKIRIEYIDNLLLFLNSWQVRTVKKVMAVGRPSSVCA